MKIVLLGWSALLLFLFTSGPAWAAQQSDKKLPELEERSLTLVFEGDTIGAEIKQARLEDVLTEIALKTNLSIAVEGSIADENVSAIFDPIPVEEGLHAILRNKNYVLMYSEVARAAGSSPQFKVDGIKVVGNGYGAPPPIFRSGLERDPSRPQQVERGEGVSKVGETAGNDPFQETMPQHSIAPFFPPSRHFSPHESGGVAPYKTPEAPAGSVKAINPSRRSHHSGEQQQNTEVLISPNKSSHEIIDDLEVLADEKGMAAIPFLSQVANSNSDPDFREYARYLIQSIQEDAEWDTE